MTTKEIVEAIGEAKAYLRNTDYVTLKIFEGVATKEYYNDILARRDEARKKVDELQKELKKATEEEYKAYVKAQKEKTKYAVPNFPVKD